MAETDNPEVWKRIVALENKVNLLLEFAEIQNRDALKHAESKIAVKKKTKK